MATLAAFEVVVDRTQNSIPLLLRSGVEIDIGFELASSKIAIAARSADGRVDEIAIWAGAWRSLQFQNVLKPVEITAPVRVGKGADAQISETVPNSTAVPLRGVRRRQARRRWLH